MPNFDEDDSITAYWRDVRAMRQQCSAENRKNGPAILEQHGISFVTKNGGAHLIISHNGHMIDYWPGTKRFVFRTAEFKGHGVYKLLKLLGINL